MVWDINVIGLHTKEMIAAYLNIIQERNLAEMAKPGNLKQFKINGKRLEFLSSYSILLPDSLARFPVIYLQQINTFDQLDPRSSCAQPDSITHSLHFANSQVEKGVIRAQVLFYYSTSSNCMPSKTVHTQWVRWCKQ